MAENKDCKCEEGCVCRDGGEECKDCSNAECCKCCEDKDGKPCACGGDCGCGNAK